MDRRAMNQLSFTQLDELANFRLMGQILKLYIAIISVLLYKISGKYEEKNIKPEQFLVHNLSILSRVCC
jgi:hypothetical protein